MNEPSDMLTVLRTSAHDLHAIPDATVHAIITSPPYLGLRSYQGDQDVEWPTVEYRLNEWTEPITVQGCDPDCAHEWGNEQPPHHPGQVPQTKWADVSAVSDGQTAGKGRYCLHCGGWRGPLGLEPSPVTYIGHLILCLREWRRVLRSDGCCFVNLGDSFATGTTAGRPDYSSNGVVGANNPHAQNSVNRLGTPSGLKTKDLLGIPFMFAFAARADGWYLRSDIIWAKGVSFLASYAGSSMPESVTDRPSKSHEYVFLLTKSPRYFWDQEAVKEASTCQSGAAADFKRETKEHLAPGQSATQHRDDREPTTDDGTRNLRTVWVINPQPYKKAHYAVFPERLVEPMIKAATSERGCCSACGAPWKRVVEKSDRVQAHWPNTEQVHAKAAKGKHGATSVIETGSYQTYSTLGWQPTCTCGAGEHDYSLAGGDVCSKCKRNKTVLAAIGDTECRYDPVPCKVLDPFSGSGTTARVAIRLGRHAIVSDISNEYLSDHVPGRTTVQMEML